MLQKRKAVCAFRDGVAEIPAAAKEFQTLPKV